MTGDDEARIGAMERAADFQLPRPTGPRELDKMIEASRVERVEREAVVRMPRLSFLDKSRKLPWEAWK